MQANPNASIERANHRLEPATNSTAFAAELYHDKQDENIVSRSTFMSLGESSYSSEKLPALTIFNEPRLTRESHSFSSTQKHHTQDKDTYNETAAASLMPVLPESADIVSIGSSNQNTPLRTNEHYLLGIELTLAAVVAFSGMAKARKQQNELRDCESESISNVDADDDKQEENSAKATYFRRKSHRVSSFDTLQSIAEALFRDRRIAWLIADMNCASTKEEYIEGRRVIELRPGQTLELPSPEEAERFVSQLRRDFEIEKLVTVVSDSRVDSDVLNKFLGSVAGLAQPQLLPN